MGRAIALTGGFTACNFNCKPGDKDKKKEAAMKLPRALNQVMIRRGASEESGLHRAKKNETGGLNVSAHQEEVREKLRPVLEEKTLRSGARGREKEQRETTDR